MLLISSLNYKLILNMVSVNVNMVNSVNKVINMDKTDYRLCGGTFFVLLLQALKQRTKARSHIKGETDGLDDSSVLIGLFKVAFPTYAEPHKESFRTITSAFKSCQRSDSMYIPMTEQNLVDSFDSEIHTDYAGVVTRMEQFVEQFLNREKKCTRLVCSLYDLVVSDSTIDDQDVFYVDENGNGITKALMRSCNSFRLANILVGIWHFVITKRADNSVGSETYINWHSQPVSKNGRRKFISTIGSDFLDAITLRDVGVEALPNEEIEYNSDTDNLFNDIAPELTDQPPLIVLPASFLEDESDVIRKYLRKAKDKYIKLKTLLYADNPKPFYDFYVCNNVSQRIRVNKNSYSEKVIHNPDADLLATCSNYVIITGTGGLGKSMLMRHLLLDSIDKFDDGGRIPIFIALKDYISDYDSITSYVFDKFSCLCDEVDISDFTQLLTEGRFLLLFDGLDEISTECRRSFETRIDSFTDKYSGNMFVISSRPFSSFISYNRFTVLYLKPFTKIQALQLIDKLDFRPDEPIIKENFRQQLDSKIYYSHTEFTQNPLLLTIMLMTFEQFAEVPSKMHIFYREAYLALSQKHDANKGAYKRTLKMNITADRFADYFAEFCARTYRDEKFELSEHEFEEYFKKLNEARKDDLSAEYTDFIYDLVNNLCLMYFEGNRFHFTHRSFQEYFCALYFSKQKDKTLKAIGDFFEKKRQRNFGDKTFHMLYDMIPDKIQEYIFIPYLTDLFAHCDSENGYQTFLETLYLSIYYSHGEVPDIYDNAPLSFLYRFIIEQFEINPECGRWDTSMFPEESDFETEQFGYLADDWVDLEGNSYEDELMEIDEAPFEYVEEYGYPDIVGRHYEFEVSQIYEEFLDYGDFCNILESDDFPLKVEYKLAKELLESLSESLTPKGDDLFDLF